MLVIKNLTKKYDNLTAVNELNLEIKKGEFFGLLGPNGAGKSTTIRMISTLTLITSGDIIINNKSMDRNLKEVKMKIGVVPQGNNLEVEMTAWENLELHGRLYNMPKDIRRKRIEELLEFTELNKRANDLVKGYSGGMKRKLMIARALMHKPDLLLLDEPTVGLDATARRKMWDLLKTLKDKGLTVLLTTHYIEEAEVLCDRVGLIDGGHLIELDSPERLIEKVGKYTVEHFQNGETKEEFFEKREEAASFAAELQGSVNIRPSNLEDVFIKLTNRRVGA
ncbi:ABC-2 type transport system ATP-binding protein [Clostridium tetanomorphum]|uniref:ABC transporter ATP-binding protein n=1 Tax=Clostridium tetanomorphum TaxID=1553 RepID=A0A923E7J5_CLOTT|nr:ABC transporter ATP-binding protein [Clostridium tetanomorphum]KAJ52353.1 nod factor export ATP-binding protein I [Clostridium tetanomorphum DSM 665]MBC2397873.1 ABC transporter ATP-binding protein [Clostridium tetanomorphum]MBP1864812.1 ABC-2 type transport system ATP-binding protein [Clostridium tetanomorphum]NRS83988.1 ABC-2 type transport system ATP-binding protein [Clostridium tetanomorphum]NRZ97206.1 ABC-2 type transport system ATP-binding protein [Clostridium tetanomorphum]